MDNKTVLVIDGDSKNLQILKESLESADFRVLAIDDGIKAWEAILMQRPDIIVSEVDLPGMDGFQLLSKLQKDPVAASIPLIFLTNRRNIEDRLKSLRSGVKDYMIKPLHVKEVVARLNMILRRIERTKVEESESGRKIIGRLEEKSVEELVETCGAEKRTGVLALYGHKNLNGEIYFRKGSVIKARLGNFKAEKAVYQMLPWREGHFVLTLKEINVEEEITVSNLGLLLQGFKRLQEREQLIRQLPSLDSVFVRTTVFDQILTRKTISSDAHKFIALFDGRRTVSDILAESIYDDIKTLEKTARLYEQGFIKPIGDVTPTPTRIPKPERPEVPSIEEQLPIRRMPDQTTLDDLENDDILEHENDRFLIEEPVEPPFLSEADMAEEDLADEPGFEDDTPDLGDESLQDESSSIDEPFKSHSFETEVEAFGIESPPFDEEVLRTMEAAPPEDDEEHIEFEEQDEEFELEAATPEQPASEPDNGSAVSSDTIAAATDNPLTSLLDELVPADHEMGRLVIIGSNDMHRRELVATLTDELFTQKAIDSDGRHKLEFSRILTPSERTVEIFGLATHNLYLKLFDQISASLVGYILLVEANNTAEFGYLCYLINSLKRKYALPHLVAVFRTEDRKPVPHDVIRYSLKMDEQTLLIETNPKDRDSVSYLLKQLIPSEHPDDVQTRQQNTQDSVHFARS